MSVGKSRKIFPVMSGKSQLPEARTGHESQYHVPWVPVEIVSRTPLRDGVVERQDSTEGTLRLPLWSSPHLCLFSTPRLEPRTTRPSQTHTSPSPRPSYHTPYSDPCLLGDESGEGSHWFGDGVMVSDGSSDVGAPIRVNQELLLHE